MNEMLMTYFEIFKVFFFGSRGMINHLNTLITSHKVICVINLQEHKRVKQSRLFSFF